MKIDSHKISQLSIIGSLILLAMALRLLFFYVPSFDITKFIGAWYDTFIEIGRIDAFADIFYNYSPPYLYMIDIMTLFTFIPKEQAIKLVSVIFDFFAAVAVFKILEIRFPQGLTKFAGFFVLLFTPTVFIESSMWGQCDIIYTAFLLWSLFFILKEKPFYAILFFSVAFSFKLQAVFFAPIFAILFLRKKFPLHLFLVVPVVFFISVVPAWLAGGPLGGLLTIYFSQIETYQALSMRAPNLYLFLNPETFFETKVLAGMIITFLVVAAYIGLRWLKWKETDSLSVYFDAAFFTMLIPFLLPKMHERYFFIAGLLLILLAFQERKFISIAILTQVSSLLSFIPYFSSWPDTYPMIGAVLNCVAIIGLFYFYYDHRKTLVERVSEKVFTLNTTS